MHDVMCTFVMTVECEGYVRAIIELSNLCGGFLAMLVVRLVFLWRSCVYALPLRCQSGSQTLTEDLFIKKKRYIISLIVQER